jgi:hypothetical protein
MRKLDETGSLLVPLIIVIVLFLGAASFGVWAFMGRQDYKTNSDAKSTKAVATAEKVLSAKKDAEFAEKEKSPVKTYTGPTADGTLKLDYPKTWAAYVIEKDASPGVNGYMFPNYVPDVSSKGFLFALRIQVSDIAYDKVLKNFDVPIKIGKVTATAYQPAKVAGVIGTRFTGAVVPGDSQKQGVMVVLPLRDKTIQIWTEGDSFRGDFDTIVLPSLTFIP